MNGAVGVYGKLPAQADFVRCNTGDLARLGLDRWLQEANEVMTAERLRLPPEPVHFVLSPAGSRAAVLGALAPSTDAVGRSFPLVACAVLDAASLGPSFSGLPTAYESFFGAAAALVEGAEGLTAADVAARAGTMTASLAPASVPAVADALERELLAGLGIWLGGLPHGAAYALRTLTSACDQSRAAATKGPAITLDAPAPSAASRLLWLELCRARLGWRDQLPSFIWTAGRASPGRLLVTLGPPTTSIFAFLANPRHKSTRLWPLITEVGTALDAAVAALTSDQQRVLGAPPSTLADVLACFASPAA
jgi:type VI secretion system protein ImpM